VTTYVPFEWVDDDPATGTVGTIYDAERMNHIEQGIASVEAMPGPQGEPGTLRFHGTGPPTLVIGARPGDEYLDTTTGDLYRLE
jgi:hypothetical protein